MLGPTGDLGVMEPDQVHGLVLVMVAVPVEVVDEEERPCSSFANTSMTSSWNVPPVLAMLSVIESERVATVGPTHRGGSRNREDGITGTTVQESEEIAARERLGQLPQPALLRVCPDRATSWLAANRGTDDGAQSMPLAAVPGG